MQGRPIDGFIADNSLFLVSSATTALMGFSAYSSIRHRPFLLPLLFAALYLGSAFALSNSDYVDLTRVVQLSWRPRAFMYKVSLSDEECEHLKLMAKDKLEKSMVADNESGKSVISKDEVVARIEKRISTWTFLPEENAELMQILYYELGEKYEPHFDYFHDKINQRIGGRRVATVLMYLSDVLKGGETIFPNAESKLLQLKDDSWSDCAKNGYADFFFSR